MLISRVYMGYNHYIGVNGIKQTGEGLPDSPAGIGEGNFNVLPKTKTVCTKEKGRQQPPEGIRDKRILTMITTIIDLDLDQQRSRQQAEISLELFISGEGDGFKNGVRPANSDLAYLRGYASGMRRKMADIQRHAELLEAEGLAVEATVEAIFGEKIPF